MPSWLVLCSLTKLILQLFLILFFLPSVMMVLDKKAIVNLQFLKAIRYAGKKDKRICWAPLVWVPDRFALAVPVCRHQAGVKPTSPLSHLALNRWAWTLVLKITPWFLKFRYLDQIEEFRNFVINQRFHFFFQSFVIFGFRFWFEWQSSVKNILNLRPKLDLESRSLQRFSQPMHLSVSFQPVTMSYSVEHFRVAEWHDTTRRTFVRAPVFESQLQRSFSRYRSHSLCHS